MAEIPSEVRSTETSELRSAESRLLSERENPAGLTMLNPTDGSFNFLRSLRVWGLHKNSVSVRVEKTAGTNPGQELVCLNYLKDNFYTYFT